MRSPLFDSNSWVEHGFGTRENRIDQDSTASLRQIHSAEVLVVDREGCAGEGDGLITSKPDVILSIRTADCYPVLLVDIRARVIAALHAGWRGTAAGIVPAAIRLMASKFGTSASDIFAAIGPGIGGCCYEVGTDVARRFGLATAGHVDLGQANQDQLIEAGVAEAHIDRLNLCTFCDAARFHSYRRDKDAAGRMTSFVRIRPNG